MRGCANWPASATTRRTRRWSPRWYARSMPTPIAARSTTLTRQPRGARERRRAAPKALAPPRGDGLQRPGGHMTLRLKIQLIVVALTLTFIAAVLTLQYRAFKESVN